jgi:hypothetical protein
MSDLPDINFQDNKKKEKRGFLPWLRARLGFGGRGAIGGASNLPGAANIGRAAFGVGRLGVSSGMGALFAGKAGFLLTAAIVAAAVGTGVYMKNQPSQGVSTAAFSSNKSPLDNYIPAIMRQQRNQGSSLDMLRDTNQGAASMDAYDAEGYDKNGYDKDGYDKNGYDKSGYDKDGYDKNGYDKNGYDRDGYDKNGYDRNGLDRNGAQNPNQGNMAQQMMGKLVGGDFSGGLSGSSGGSKFSQMGGFSNKFGQGVVGAKVNPTSGIGAGFQSMAKFDQRKKALAMKGSARPVYAKTAGAKKGTYGKGSYGQAKGIKSTQQSYTGTGIDANRSTQDLAWQGSTGEGSPVGGAGLSSGGPPLGAGNGGTGVVTAPGIDNTSTPPSPTSPANTPTDPSTPAAEPTFPEPTPTDVSPWASLVKDAMTMILLSAVLSALGGKLVTKGKAMMANPYTAAMGMILYGIGIALCVVAMGLAMKAIMNGMQVIGQQGQAMLGGIYVLGGGIAMAAAIMAMTGSSLGGITPMWMSAIAGILGLLGTMAKGILGAPNK